MVLARSLGLQFQRIQFTSDMLPADIVGVSVYDRGSSAFIFHPGPIFAQVILADEVNRATPKTQSALLEAMEEHQVTAEGETRPLPRAVLRHRDPEPVGAGRHLSAAGIAARPVPDANRAGLSRPRRRARAALGHRPARPAGRDRAVHVARRTGRAAGRRARGARRARPARLRAGDRRAHAAIAGLRRRPVAARRARAGALRRAPGRCSRDATR